MEPGNQICGWKYDDKTELQSVLEITSGYCLPDKGMHTNLFCYSYQFSMNMIMLAKIFIIMYIQNFIQYFLCKVKYV